MQRFFSHLDNILVLAIFIYLILLINGKIRMQPNRQEKLDELVRRRGMLLKILVYGGALFFTVVLIINLL